jgi:hypothetical protein
LMIKVLGIIAWHSLGWSTIYTSRISVNSFLPDAHVAVKWPQGLRYILVGVIPRLLVC